MAMKAQISPMRTLVVDDSEDECALLNVRLRPIHQIKLIGFVHDGVEAIHYLRGVEQFRNRELFPYPDLLLLDFEMPRSNGMQVLRFLQGQSHRPRIILWSNTPERVDVPLALHLGADFVSGKPSSRHELAEIIDRFETKIFGSGSFMYSARKPHAKRADS